VEIRDVGALLPDPAAALWRVSVPPAAAPALAAALPGDWFLDWGGGLIWIAVPPGTEAEAARIRGAVAAAGTGGHATLLRAPASLRAGIDVFHPQPAALARLTARVKESFDPKRILNPGRLYAGV
jgi:glycolate oxidase FAD binding subunit